MKQNSKLYKFRLRGVMSTSNYWNLEN